LVLTGVFEELTEVFGTPGITGFSEPHALLRVFRTLCITRCFQNPMHFWGFSEPQILMGVFETPSKLRYFQGLLKSPGNPLAMLTWEAKVVYFWKIWWRLNEALLNYLEAITIGMKSTLMKERRLDDIHGDQGWNVCSPCSYIIKKVYL